MKFSKWQGIGNDFVVINCLEESLDKLDINAFAVKVCDRNFGIGADGLALIMPSVSADFRMRLINSDGSEAEMCGNVMRCLAKFMYEEGLITKKIMSVETLAGIIKPEILLDNGCINKVRVDMGEPRILRGQIPMTGNPNEMAVNVKLDINGAEFFITTVSMGNPHCVIFVDDINKINLSQIGPLIEKHQWFPKKTNVEFVQILNSKEVRMRVWERGAGITLACGTGASATLVASALNNKTERSAVINLDGGSLLVEWGADNHVYMTGPATKVFEGTL